MRIKKTKGRMLLELGKKRKPTLEISKYEEDKQQIQGWQGNMANDRGNQLVMPWC